MTYAKLITRLSEAQADQKAAGETVRLAAEQASVEMAVRAIMDAYNATLPEQYQQFLQSSDGLDYNGLVLYSCCSSPDKPDADGFWQGLVRTNAIWRDRDDTSEVLVLGDSDTDFFTVDLEGESPVARDRVNGEIVQEYIDIFTMIEDLIANRL